MIIFIVYVTIPEEASVPVAEKKETILLEVIS
jgi:hypothetical protein